MQRAWLRIVCASLFAALLVGRAAHARDVQVLPITRLPLDGALTQNSVTDMLQDRSGLIWFATEGGLHVYDGYQFHVIPSDPRDPESLAGVRVSRLFEDRSGHIWVAGSVGWLDRFDPRSGRIRHFPAELYGPRRSPQSAPTGLYESPDGSIWIGTNLGLHRYMPATDQLELHVDAVEGREPLRNVVEILPAANGRLWLASDALYRFDPDGRRLEAFRHAAADPRSPSADGVTSMHVDPDGTLWFGTNAGLNRWNGEGRGFTHFRHDPRDPRSLGSDSVWDVMRDSKGRLWVGCLSGGLNLFRDGGFDVLLSDKDDANSLSIDDVWSLFEDRSGLLWIGTAGGGLNQVNPSRHRFEALRSIPFNNNSLRSPMVWDLQQDAQQRIWMATLAGIESYDPVSGAYALHTPVPGSVAGNQMQSLHIDRRGRIWAGSVDGRLYNFDPASATFRSIAHPDASDGSFSAFRVWYIGEDRDDRIWVASTDELVALDGTSTTIVERIKASEQLPLGGSPIRVSLVDSDGVLWFGGGGAGLIRYETGKGVTAVLGHEPGAPGTLSDNGVRSLYEARDGSLWVGTYNGLNRLRAADRRAARNRFDLYTQAEGLANNTIYGILPDPDGRLWLSTNRGLSRLDPDSGEVRNFNSGDGLVGDEMNGGAELVAADGTLYFGGVNGVTRFRPGEVPRNGYVPQVRITRVTVNGKPLAGGLVAQRQRVELGYHQNDLALAFAATDFHQPAKNRFRYRLGGHSDDWIETDRNSVTLAELAPGSYRFEVLGSNNDGVWSTTPAALEIVVRPPWWGTPLAYALYVLVLAGALLRYHRVQRRKLVREQHFNESLADAHSLAEAHRQMALRHAQFDELTQLPNRTSLMDALERYLRFARARRTRLAVLLLNLDRFQRVNDTVGHHLGDEVLRATALHLQRAVASGDFLARAGSDEFAIVAVCPTGADLEGWLDAIAARAAESISQPHAVLDPPLRMTASIGVAWCDGGEDTPGDLLAHANIALHAAKREGGHRVRRYVSGMMESARERLGVEARMRRALEADEFVLHFQPEVNAVDGRLVGFEALVRWQTLGQGLLPPAKFIPIAEELGLIVELGRWVLHAACRQAREWLDAGHAEFAIAVNVSARQLHDPGFVDEVRGALARWQLPARMIELELTESALMEDVDRVSATMHALKALGVTLALDDFGVGYSSLSYLKRLPIDKIKIDRSFVCEITERSDDAAIVRAVIAMSHQLRMKVLAEGVETEAQLGYLRRNHCDQCQGQLFAMPQPALAAERLLRQRVLSAEAFTATRPTRTLLLLDDEDNVRTALVRVLRPDGYRVLTAATAAEAFAILGREDVQVVLADQRMPDVSGTEFLTRVKAMHPDTVRLILSGYTDLATVTDAINRGAIYKFLTKPWDAEDLREQIRDAFRTYVERRVVERVAVG